MAVLISLKADRWLKFFLLAVRCLSPERSHLLSDAISVSRVPNRVSTGQGCISCWLLRQCPSYQNLRSLIFFCVKFYSWSIQVLVCRVFAYPTNTQWHTKHPIFPINKPLQHSFSLNSTNTPHAPHPQIHKSINPSTYPSSVGEG